MNFSYAKNDQTATLPVSEDIKTVLYYGLNGYGITWTYFLVHLGLAFVSVGCLVLNVFSISVLRNQDSSLDVSIAFISSLACNDILNGIWCIYLVLYNLIHYKNYYECAFRNGIVTGTSLNSGLHLLALTVDRYVKIIHPLKYVSIFKEKPAKYYCMFAWIVSTVVCLLPNMGVRKPPSRGIFYCSFFGVQSDEFLWFSVGCFFVILLANVFCYMRIFSASFVQMRRVTRPLWWRPTKTILLLIVFYFICWLPLVTSVLLHLTGGFPAHYTDDMKGTVLAYGAPLVYLDTIVNPLIYAWKIRAVRLKVNHVLKRFLPYVKCMKSEQHSSGNEIEIHVTYVC